MTSRLALFGLVLLGFVHASSHLLKIFSVSDMLRLPSPPAAAIDIPSSRVRLPKHQDLIDQNILDACTIGGCPSSSSDSNWCTQSMHPYCVTLTHGTYAALGCTDIPEPKPSSLRAVKSFASLKSLDHASFRTELPASTRTGADVSTSLPSSVRTSSAETTVSAQSTSIPPSTRPQRRLSHATTSKLSRSIPSDVAAGEPWGSMSVYVSLFIAAAIGGLVAV